MDIAEDAAVRSNAPLLPIGSSVLVADLDDFDRLQAAGRAHLDAVAFPGLEQRPGNGCRPAHLARLQPRLVDPDDANGPLLVLVVDIGDGRAEIDMVAVL